MAGNSTISIAYKVESVEGGFRKLTMDAEDFRKAMKANVVEAQNLKKSFMDFSVVSTGFRNIGESATTIKNALDSVISESMDFEKAMKAANTMKSTTNET